jgi:hypothetical protein
MKIHSIYDAGENGGADRYTVYYKGRGTLDHTSRGTLRACLGMSDNPFHPQGVGMHGTGQPGKHNGKRITFDQLPADCQKAVEWDLNPGAKYIP